MFLLLRFCCASLSACIILLLPGLAYLFLLISPDLDWFSLNELAFKIKLITGAFWMVLWGVFEIRSLRRPTPKLLTHLRYGPIAVLVFSIATVATYDVLMIQYSRWQIVRYIHSDAPVTERPSLKLYNNYRSFCVNGMAANEYELYGDTPAAYIDDADPAIRARALQASMYVYDWINLPNDGPAMHALRMASADSDPTVREVAEKLRGELSH